MLNKAVFFFKNNSLYVPLGVNVNDLNLWEAILVSINTTIKFWLTFFFNTSLRDMPRMLDILNFSPQLFPSTFNVFYIVCFFFFLMTKKTLSNRRILAVVLFTLIFIHAGFFIAENLSNLLLINKNPQTFAAWPYKDTLKCNTTVMVELTNTLHFCWKFFGISLGLVMWAFLVYRNDLNLFTRFKTAQIGFWVFTGLFSIFYIWAGLKSRFFIFIITELVAFLFLFVLVKQSKNTILSVSRNSWVVFILLKFILLIFLFMVEYCSFFYINKSLLGCELFTLFCFAWYYSWDRLILIFFSKKNPTLDGLLNNFLRIWLVVNFFLIITLSIAFFSWLLILALIVFNLQKHGNLIYSSPDYAWTRVHKITMFEPAPIAVEPPQLIKSVPFNSNVFVLLANINNYYYQLIPLVIYTLPECSINLVVSLTVSFSITFWFGYYSAVKVAASIKSSDILDWRGLFLVIHQYHWSVKYSMMLSISFALLFTYTTLSMIFTLFTLTANYFLIVSGVSFWFLFFVVITCRGYFLWSRILTFFEDFSYSSWNDVFWKNLSPYLRDVLYWRPLPPDDDDEDEEDPFFFGFSHKATSKTFLFIYMFFTFFCLVITPETLSDLNIPLFLWCFKTGTIYFVFIRVYIATSVKFYPNEMKAIQDYAFFEAGTHLLMAFVLIVSMYIIYNYIFLGLFMFLFGKEK